MIQRLLVANRGEIARRVFATCRRLGIETVAVHSDADAGLPFVAEADHAVRLPGNAPADTYLRVDLVLEAARRTGADAVHPGYGFLSENADFARAVIDAGLTWVGPPPEAIETMGDKVRAKQVARKAGVPVVLSAPSSPTEADLPLLVKASAGGGGRGMRVVRSLERLDAEIEAASAEAASAFGDGTVFVEPYVEAGRHVEVQLVAAEDDDAPTAVLVLGTRDCSVQRRHQKVVEEAPAPGLPPRTRIAMEGAAASLAQRIGYRGAGTVEFLHDPATDRFFFLEMNTRLQVEHPVSELVWREDLVELQIAVAEGRGLGGVTRLGAERRRGEPGIVQHEEGHAIEVRLYAEDATYTPQSGRLVTFDLPADGGFGLLQSAGVRVDSGFASGDEVSTFYDAMLAKVMAWAPTRDQAIRMLVAALRRARIHGVTTNRDQLLEILSDPVFVAGEMTTTWLESRERVPLRGDWAGATLLSATTAVVLDRDERRTVQRGVPTGWRNVRSQWQVEHFIDDHGHDVDGEWVSTRTGVGIGFPNADFDVQRVTRLEHGWRIDWSGEGESGWCEVRFGAGPPGNREVYVDSPRSGRTLREVPRFTDPADAVASGSLLAPMPGTVVAVSVEAGREVAAGDVVLVLEAMKMQHTVTAPHGGTVTEINVEPGTQVASGEVLAVVEEKA